VRICISQVTGKEVVKPDANGAEPIAKKKEVTKSVNVQNKVEIKAVVPVPKIAPKVTTIREHLIGQNVSNKPSNSKPHKNSPTPTAASLNMIKRLVKMDGSEFYKVKQSLDAYQQRYGNADPREVAKSMRGEQKSLTKNFKHKQNDINESDRGSTIVNDHDSNNVNHAEISQEPTTTGS
jgi:hypothetical protein